MCVCMTKRETDRQTDRQADRQEERQTGRNRKRERETDKDRQAERETDRQWNWEKQTYKDRDKHTDRHTERMGEGELWMCVILVQSSIQHYSGIAKSSSVPCSEWGKHVPPSWHMLWCFGPQIIHLGTQAIWHRLGLACWQTLFALITSIGGRFKPSTLSFYWEQISSPTTYVNLPDGARSTLGWSRQSSHESRLLCSELLHPCLLAKSEMREIRLHYSLPEGWQRSFGFADWLSLRALSPIVDFI